MKQNYIDFLRKLDWFPYKPEIYLKRNFLNLPKSTYSDEYSKKLWNKSNINPGYPSPSVLLPEADEVREPR